MMGRSGAPVVEPPELPAELEMAGAMMGILLLLADPARLAAAVHDLDEATAAYHAIKDEADKATVDLDHKAADDIAAREAATLAMGKRVADLTSREEGLKAREDAIKAREDAMAAREAKLRAAMD